MGLYLLAQLSLCGVVISIEDSLLKSQPSFFGLFLANTTRSIAASDQQADDPELRAARLALVQLIAALPLLMLVVYTSAIHQSVVLGGSPC